MFRKSNKRRKQIYRNGALGMAAIASVITRANFTQIPYVTGVSHPKPPVLMAWLQHCRFRASSFICKLLDYFYGVREGMIALSGNDSHQIIISTRIREYLCYVLMAVCRVSGLNPPSSFTLLERPLHNAIKLFNRKRRTQRLNAVTSESGSE